MKTPIENAIIMLPEDISHCEDVAYTKAINKVREVLKSILPYERKVLEKFFRAGENNKECYECEEISYIEDFETFYNTTFNTCSAPSYNEHQYLC